MIHYEKLLRVTFQHNYFFKQRCTALKAIPTPHCQKIIQNYGLVFKEIDSGFGVLYKKSNIPTKIPDILSQTPLKLSFAIYNSNPLLENYSELPFSQSGKGYYFSNLNTFSKDDSLFLHQKEKLDEEALVDLFSSAINYEIIQEADDSVKKGEKKSIQVKVLNEEQQVLKTAEVILLAQEQKEENGDISKIFKGSYLLKLTGKPFGKYELQIEGQPPKFFYIAESEPERIWGMIDIYLRNSDIISGLGSEEAKVEFQDYKIFIEARKTVWQYFLVSRAKESFSDLELVNGRSSDKFKDPPMVALPNGTSATLLTIGEDKSPVGIRLKEKPSQKFQLKFKKSSEEVASISHTVFLPIPDGARIENISYKDKISGIKKENDESIFYSSLYVYL